MRLILTFACAVLLSAPVMAGTQIGELAFTSSFDSLMAQAQGSQKTIVIKFFTDW